MLRSRLARFWLCSAALVVGGGGKAACADVRLEVRPSSQSVTAGQTVEVALYAVADPSQPAGKIEAIISWNFNSLELIGNHGVGAFGWSSSGFPSGGLNDDLSDGKGFYRATGGISPCTAATATPGGVLVTTLQFRALEPTFPTSVTVGILSDFDVFQTRVWDKMDPVCGGVPYATTPLGPPVGITITACSGAPDCIDGDACTDDVCNVGICEHPANFDAADFCCNPTNGNLTTIDDGNDCTNDLCIASTGTVIHPDESFGTACGSQTDDACTGPDTCDGSGVCEPNNKQDGGFCTNTDPCVTAAECDTGICVGTSFVANGTACEDGLACTGTPANGDSCQDGVCTGGPTPCTVPALPQCFEDVADPCPGGDLDCASGFSCLNGTCKAPICGNCEDDSVCPDMGCVRRVCSSVKHTCVTALVDDQFCQDQDGLFCNGEETCRELDGACLPAISGPCPDPDLSACDEVNDVCVECLTNNDCDQSDPCIPQLCASATCLPVPIDCSAFNDSCNIGVCQAGSCQSVPAESIGCSVEPCPPGYDCGPQGFCLPLACDDADVCTTGDRCSSGVCAGDPPVTNGTVDLKLQPPLQTVNFNQIVMLALVASSSDGGDHGISTIEAILLWDPIPLTGIGNTDPCTDVVDPIEDCDPGEYDWGLLSGFPSGGLDPDGLNVTFLDGNAKYIAQRGPNDDDAPVTAAQALTVTVLEFVALGATDDVGTEVSFALCLGNNPSFTRIVGDGAGNVITGQLVSARVRVHCKSASQCDDGDSCTIDACDDASSFCTHAAQPDGGMCGNQTPTSECDQPDICISGVCDPNPKSSGTFCTDDGSECTNDVCDGAAACVHLPLPQGTACGDPDPASDCDQPDACDGVGTCDPNFEPAGNLCDDADECTSPDRCDGFGSCTGTVIQGCRDCMNDADCDDGVSCTQDICVDFVCQNNDICADDGLFCTGVEFCNLGSGFCVSSGNPCPGQCTEQDGCPCQMPSAKAAGSRYLAIRPEPIDSLVPVKLRVESPDFPCLVKFVGFLACGGNGKVCKMDADCNACTGTGDPCLTNGDCMTCSDQTTTPCQVDADCNPLATCISVQTCEVSDEFCISAASPATFDIDSDGIIDGSLATLVDDPLDALSLTPGEWINMATDHCSMGQNVCADDSDCDLGNCLLPDGRPSGVTCSVSAPDCASGLPCERSEICLKGMVYVTGEDIVPTDLVDGSLVETTYGVRADCGALTDAALATMPLWGDADQNGVLNVTDVSFLLFVINGRFDAKRLITIPSGDLSTSNGPCFTNQIVNANDLLRLLRAFRGETYRQAVNSTSGITGCMMPCAP